MRPSSENTFSWAFSRIEQVLNRITSASSTLSVGSMPCVALSTSTILSESYSFIWQPYVLTNTFFMVPVSVVYLGASGAQQVDSKNWRQWAAFQAFTSASVMTQAVSNWPYRSSL